MIIGHAPRERVSWNVKSSAVFAKLIRHAPRERVSWNYRQTIPVYVWGFVTLHVSVWVEIAEFSDNAQ